MFFLNFVSLPCFFFFALPGFVFRSSGFLAEERRRERKEVLIFFFRGIFVALFLPPPDTWEIPRNRKPFLSRHIQRWSEVVIFDFIAEFPNTFGRCVFVWKNNIHSSDDQESLTRGEEQALSAKDRGDHKQDPSERGGKSGR